MGTNNKFIGGAPFSGGLGGNTRYVHSAFNWSSQKSMKCNSGASSGSIADCIRPNMDFWYEPLVYGLINRELWLNYFVAVNPPAKSFSLFGGLVENPT